MKSSSRTIKPWHRGHHWTSTPDTCPTLLSANEAQWAGFDPAFRVSLPYWALTGLLTAGLKVRAGAETAPWLRQPAFTLRLYPPGCPFWEDAEPAAEPLRSVWLDFTGGERIGLERFLDRTRGYATFEDPEGLLLRQIQSMAHSAAS